MDAKIGVGKSLWRNKKSIFPKYIFIKGNDTFSGKSLVDTTLIKRSKSTSPVIRHLSCTPWYDA